MHLQHFQFGNIAKRGARNRLDAVILEPQLLQIGQSLERGPTDGLEPIVGQLPESIDVIFN